MAPKKRQRPDFSPPRPRKTTGASTTKSSVQKNRSTKSKPSKATPDISSKIKSKGVDASKRRSRLVSPTPSASDSLGEESEDDEEPSESGDNEEENEDTNLTNQGAEDSPEPDYILAEVTHESTASKEPPIPLGLVHRILHSQFAAPEKTKISTDAREVVGKYIEIFVREAIMRCAYEKNEEGGDGGWLELEDLEKVAVQLSLDF